MLKFLTWLAIGIAILAGLATFILFFVATWISGDLGSRIGFSGIITLLLAAVSGFIGYVLYEKVY